MNRFIRTVLHFITFGRSSVSSFSKDAPDTI